MQPETGTVHRVHRSRCQYLFISQQLMHTSKQPLLAFALGLLTVVACLPVILTPHIPLADYPNHLARVQIWDNYLQGVKTPYLEPVFALQPNMALDLIVLSLTQFMNIKTAGKIFIILTIISTIWGPIILSKRINSKLSALNALPIFFVYNRLFFWGFLGYLFSLGTAIGASSLWFNSTNKEPNFKIFLARSAASTVVLACHLYAFGVLSILAVCFSVLNLSKDRKFSLKNFLFAVLPLTIPLPLFAIASPAFSSTHAVEWGAFVNRLIPFVGVFIGQTPWIDVATGFATILFIAWVIATKRGTVPNWGIVLLAGMIGLQLMMPDKILSSYGADKRLPIAIALIATALVRPVPTQSWFKFRLFLGLIGIIFLTRLYYIDQNWKAFTPIYLEHKQAYENIPKNSRIISIVGTHNPYGLPPIPLTEHAGYAVIDRNVFWPGIFAYPVHGAQTIKFKSLTTQEYIPAGVQKLPIDEIEGILKGEIIYSGYDFKKISPCYEYITVSLENSLKNKIPQTSIFGEKIYETAHVAIYKINTLGKCL